MSPFLNGNSVAYTISWKQTERRTDNMRCREIDEIPTLTLLWYDIFYRIFIFLQNAKDMKNIHICRDFFVLFEIF